jgi:BirA family biotin operon repressor/biotin-[acetyl-CoA-carboxylase] ligase
VIADDVALQRAGHRAFAGFRLQTVASTPSTQDMVRAEARGGAPSGFCCIAGLQTAGRGRHDRGWEAPPGSALLCSVLVRVSPSRLGGVALAAGLSVRAAIMATTGVSCALKWPNDVLAEGRKLAGILCEVEPAAPEGGGTAVVIGTGVNLAVPGFPPGARGVSLHELVGSPPSPAILLAAILPELADRLARLEASGVPGLRPEWLAHAAGIGEPVRAVSSAGTTSGVATGIDDDGALLIDTGHGVTRVLAGDVHIGLPAP